jgi:beta-glucanase (GH16 family)
MTTIERTGYGYYEILARPAKAEFDNAFWLADTGDPDNRLEIDIFEMGPHTRDYHNKDVMTAHVWGEHGDKRHWGYLVAYTTPWDVGDDFHTYGFEWTKDNLIWYIDGVPVRKLKNTNWHLPQRLIFDCEPMVDWFGPIDDKDFPTAFIVKYLRVWRQPGYVPPVPVTPPPVVTKS